jgi:hypothetical protein
MNLIKVLKNTTKYLTEAFFRIFSPPNQELPPEIGVQPFEYKPYQEKS